MILYHINIDGIPREYYIHTPVKMDANLPLPLVVMLHGAGGGARSIMRLSGMNELAEKEGFMVVYPLGTGKRDRMLSWNAGHCCGFAKENKIDDVAFIGALIDEIQQDWRVDPARVYVAGISNGGMMAHRLGCELSEKISGLAVVAGAKGHTDSIPVSPPSVILFHGTADLYVPIKGGRSVKHVIKDRGVREPIHPPLQEALEFWVSRLGCSSEPRVSNTPPVRSETYTNADSGCEVVLYTIEGGGHTWPGTVVGNWRNRSKPMQRVPASQIIWEFFSRHPKH